MRKLIVGLALLSLVAAVTVAQEVKECHCDKGTCSVHPHWGNKVARFTIPTSAIVSLLAKLPKVAGVVIPDVEITLHESLFGTMEVGNCPKPCCDEGRKLRAATDVFLTGETDAIGFPPTPARVSTVVRACDVVDQEDNDEDRSPCAIISDFKIPRGGIQVNLVFAGNLEIPIYGSISGEVEGEAFVSCSCVGEPNRIPAISLPNEVKVPIGGSRTLPAEVHDPDGDPVWVYFEPVDWGEINYDSVNGQITVSVKENAVVRNRKTDAVVVYLYDLKPGVVVEGGRPARGQFYHEVSSSFTVVFVADHPPQAISNRVVRSHGERICTVHPIYEATDPDFPDNFGYSLYFLREGLPEHWSCNLSWNSWFLPQVGYVPVQEGRCSGSECQAKDFCGYLKGGCTYAAPCDPPGYLISAGEGAPPGTYEFGFTVFEFKRGPQCSRFYSLRAGSHTDGYRREEGR